MPQHFLLSSAARSLSLKDIYRLSDRAADLLLRKLRWPETDGEPVCPHCGCEAAYAYASRPIFKCKACRRQFSTTSGTIFASRKLQARDYLAAIAIFVNAAKGVSALQLARDLGVQYKTAFVLSHKLREAVALESRGAVLDGTVEVDGAWFGGYVRPENRKEDRKDRRLAENRSPDRRCVVAMRKRQGKVVPFVFKSEAESLGVVRGRIDPKAVVHADESPAWDDLHARFEMRRINHSVGYSLDGACTNQVESFFSRLRRAEWGQHHHIGSAYLGCYARESAWRENNRRLPNGELFGMAGRMAMMAPASSDWSGYWQRGRATRQSPTRGYRLSA